MPWTLVSICEHPVCSGEAEWQHGVTEGPAWRAAVITRIVHRGLAGETYICPQCRRYVRMNDARWEWREDESPSQG